MSHPSVHDHPAYAYESTRSRPVSHTTDTDDTDPYDACKDSPLVDTLVEGGVVVLIAALVNVTFWGIVRFGVNDSFAAQVA